MFALSGTGSLILFTLAVVTALLTRTTLRSRSAELEEWSDHSDVQDEDEEEAEPLSFVSSISSSPSPFEAPQ